MTDTLGMGARFHGSFRLFTVVARVTGVLWILGGLGALATWGRVEEHRALALGAAIFVVLAGIGLLIAKPPTEEQYRRFVQGPRKDSTDQRGPDEWQA